MGPQTTSLEDMAFPWVQVMTGVTTPLAMELRSRVLYFHSNNLLI